MTIGQKKWGKPLTLLMILIGIGGIGMVLFFYYPSYFRKPQGFLGLEKNASNPCVTGKFEQVQLKMADGSMKGLIELGASYQMTPGWYQCNSVQRGDVVYYRYHTEQSPVPRLVHGIPGDHFKLVKDKKRKSWNLLVNGKVVMNHDGNEPHYFGVDSVPTILSLYEKSMKGVLPPDSYLIFSTVSPGSYDSEMGVVSLSDIMGKVEISQNLNAQPK